MPAAERPNHAELWPVRQPDRDRCDATEPRANPVVELPPRAANTSLAAARPFADVGALSDYWFPDPADPGNVAVGLHQLYMKEDESPRLTQMSYAVDGAEGHFTVLWNRALMSPRR
jgi:hypothetical protein